MGDEDGDGVSDATDQCPNPPAGDAVNPSGCFLERDTEPSVEEQAAAYKSVFDAFPGKKVVLRTLDAGADKPLPVLTGSGGPFTNCTVRAHAEELVLLKPFPATAAPAEYFPDVRPPKTEAAGK